MADDATRENVRAHRRFPASTRVAFDDVPGCEPNQWWSVQDVSLGGMFVLDAPFVALGRRVDARVRLEPGLAVVPVRLDIVRHQEEPCGVGVRFVAPPEALLEDLRRLLAEHEKKAPPEPTEDEARAMRSGLARLIDRARGR